MTSCIAAFNIDNHTAFHLEAVQTLIKDKEETSLTKWYVDTVKERKETLSGISKYFVVDAWFSKKSFVDEITAMDMQLICRFRDDADLKYLFQGEQSNKRGRPRKYSGKVAPKNIDKDYFQLVEHNDESFIHSAVVFSKVLKRNVRLVQVIYTSKKGKESYKLYYSTDTEMKAFDILDYYQSRFQIEFLYRDGKQYTGLSDTQARSENKLYFHFNTSLTSINIAKVQHWLCKPPEIWKVFSMPDIKTMNHNRLLINRFIDVFGINAYSLIF